MGACSEADELAIGYMLAVESAANARRDLAWAVTVTQRECAATRFERIEAYKLDTLRDLAAHCEQHGCMTPEIEALLADSLLPRQMSVAR